MKVAVIDYGSGNLRSSPDDRAFSSKVGLV